MLNNPKTTHTFDADKAKLERDLTKCAKALLNTLTNYDLLEFASNPNTSDADIKKLIRTTESALPPRKADPINQCTIVMHSAATGKKGWIQQFKVSDAERKQALDNAISTANKER